MDNEKNILSTRIKDLRTALGLTQEELALKLGLKGKSSIANYESGNITPSDNIKIKLCELFNCSMDYLMGLSDYLNLKEIVYHISDDIILSSSVILDIVKNLTQITSFNEAHNIIRQFILIKNNYADSKEKFLEYIKKFNAETQKNILKNMDFFMNNVDFYVSTNGNYSFATSDNNYHSSSQYYMCPVYGQISAGQPNWAEECIEGRLPIDPELMGIVNPGEHFFLRVNGESMNNVVKNGAFALIHKQDMVEDGEIAVVLVNGYDATLKRFTKKGDVVVLEPDSNDPSFKTQIYDKNTPIKILGKYVGKMEINK